VEAHQPPEHNFGLLLIHVRTSGHGQRVLMIFEHQRRLVERGLDQAHREVLVEAPLDAVRDDLSEVAFRARVDRRIDKFEDQLPRLRPEAEAADGAEAGPERCQVAVRFQLGPEFWRQDGRGMEAGGHGDVGICGGGGVRCRNEIGTARNDANGEEEEGGRGRR